MEKVEQLRDSEGRIVHEKITHIKSDPFAKDGCLVANSRHKYTKQFCEKEPPYSRDTYTGMFYRLTKRLSKGSNMIIMYKGNTPINADRFSIAKLLNKSPSYTERFLIESVKIKAMVKIKSGRKSYYAINPVYAFCGQNIHISMYEHFRESIDFLQSLNRADAIEIERVYGDNVDLKIDLLLGNKIITDEGEIITIKGKKND